MATKLQSGIFALVCLSAVQGSTLKAFPCPDNNVISPCTCTGNMTTQPTVNIFCNALVTQQMADIFAGEFLFTQVYDTVITGSSLPLLGNDIFSNKVLSYLTFRENSEISFAGTSPFTSSKSSLVSFTLTQTANLENFDLSVFNGFASLTSIHITDNPSSTITGNATLNILKILNLSGNQFSQFPSPSRFRDLETLDLSHNHISSIPANTVATNSFLKTVHLNHNFLTKLGTNSLKFNSFAVTLVNVSHNQINVVESNAIVIPNNNAVVDLSSNNLGTLNREAFEPVLLNMVDDNSRVILADNPIVCNCDIAWLILAPELLMHTEGARCDRNGSLLTDLDPSYFQQLCPPVQPI